jgi:hypothetical protein
MTKEPEQPENNKFSISDLRDLLIIAGVFLFFAGWIYIYYFYDYFGISLSLVSIDYATFIVYSFIVIISYHYLPLIGIIALIIVYRKWLKKNITLSIIIALLLFPGLFLLAKSVANNNAMELRNSPNSMRQISFVFKEDAGFLAYKFNNDSLPVKNLFVETDLTILKGTGMPGQLYLLGQNVDYFFVLYQPQATPGIKELPFGGIYFINKNNVLYSKITITSNEKK